MPALSMIAVPGRRATMIELAREIEQRGFSGIWCPSYGDCMALCQEIANVTTTIQFGTAIQPIYLRHAVDLGNHAAFLHEISGGRFHLGLGVSHGPVHKQLGASVGKPLTDMRAYVEVMKANEKASGPLPPIVLATLRDKMLDLSVEISNGAVWANASLSAIGNQSRRVANEGFFVGNMLPTVIDDDRDAARAIHRRTLTGYVQLPNYRNYWKAAGFEDEMVAIEAALAAKDRDRLPSLMTNRWLDDVTLSGTADEVRDGVAQWMANGVMPILVPSAVSGGQMKAFADVFAAFAE
jgi:alkanesulfonate monooxygenase SsuD/methylene tetrahydromethanopterin reductase-like flavin-dependent oxidoreductase (luciferase family)